jgi:hypothetical protein
VAHGDTELLTDPWIDGPAYSDQWYHDYLLMSPIRGVSHLIHGPYLARQPHGWSSGGPTARSPSRRARRTSWRPVTGSKRRPAKAAPICDVSPDEDLIREDLASHVDGP